MTIIERILIEADISIRTNNMTQKNSYLIIGSDDASHDPIVLTKKESLQFLTELKSLIEGMEDTKN